MSEEKTYDVSVFVEQLASIKVKASSQRDADEKIRRVIDNYNDLDNADKKIIPYLPFEISEVEYCFYDVIDEGVFPLAKTKESFQPTYNSIIQGGESELFNLMSQHKELTQEVVDEIKSEASSEKDVSNPEEFVKLRSDEKKLKFK